MATVSYDEFLKKTGGSKKDIQVVSPKPQESTPPEQGSISQAFQGGLDQFKKGKEQATNTSNPLKKLQGGLNEASGLVSAAFSPLAPVTKYAGQAINGVADKISDSPGLQQFAQTSAGLTAMDTAEFVGNTANLVGLLGGAKVPMKSAPITEATTAGKGGVVSNALKSAGESAYGLTVAPEKSTAQAIMRYESKQPTLATRIKNLASGKETEEVGDKPITEANTAARHGLIGTEEKLGVQGIRIKEKLWNNVLLPKLEAVKGKTNMKDFLGTIEKDIRKQGGDLTRKNALLQALDSVKQDYKNVSGITLKKLQEYKSGWAEFLPDSVYNGKPIANSLKEIHDMMASKAREIIYRNVGEDGKQAYIDYGNLESIIKSGEKSMTGDPVAKSFSRNVWEFVMNKAVTPVATTAGKVLYKTGEGLELMGKPGAKTVGEVVGEKTMPVPGSALVPQTQEQPQ